MASESGRCMQKLFLEKKVLCILCKDSRNGYLKFNGLKQHVKVAHPKAKFDEEFKVNCTSFTQQLHGKETMEVLKLFCESNYVSI